MNRSDDTIRRQAAIDALRYAQHRFTVADEAGGMGTVKWSEDVIYFAAAENVLTNLPSAQQWIPVSERMPEEKKQVLVCDAYGFIYTAECEVISDDEWLDWRWYESVEYRPMDDVVAWMPLPDPWKGEENGR